jgi:hypothetical protein
MTSFNIQNSKVEQINDRGNNYKISGSGNNAISEKGNVAQAVGDENKVTAGQHSLWAQVWDKLVAFWKWLRGA